MDIIGISQLAQEYRSNRFPFDVDSDGGDTKDNKGNEPDDTGFWKSLTAELKMYGGIKLAIKEQSEKLEGIKQEISDSKKQKQEVLDYCQLAISISNILSSEICYLKGLMDHYCNEYAGSKTKPATSSPMLIFVNYDDKAGDSMEKGEAEKGEK
jgi:hypothetical protein